MTRDDIKQIPEEVVEAAQALWEAAWTQGNEGRNHDDEEGTAQTADDNLVAAITRALSSTHDRARKEALEEAAKVAEARYTAETVLKNKRGEPYASGITAIHAAVNIAAAIREIAGR